jgi:hypothetical protein
VQYVPCGTGWRVSGSKNRDRKIKNSASNSQTAFACFYLILEETRRACKKHDLAIPNNQEESRQLNASSKAEPEHIKQDKGLAGQKILTVTLNGLG